MNGSSRLVMGSKRKVAGTQYGPTPALLPAATPTVYITPSVRLAKTKVGEAASIVVVQQWRISVIYICKCLCGVSGEEGNES